MFKRLKAWLERVVLGRIPAKPNDVKTLEIGSAYMTAPKPEVIYGHSVLKPLTTTQTPAAYTGKSSHTYYPRGGGSTYQTVTTRHDESPSSDLVTAMLIDNMVNSPSPAPEPVYYTPAPAPEPYCPPAPSPSYESYSCPAPSPSYDSGSSYSSSDSSSYSSSSSSWD